MICLDYRHAKLWCCEDISKIELHLGRKQVEQLDKDNKLIEVLNELD